MVTGHWKDLIVVHMLPWSCYVRGASDYLMVLASGWRVIMCLDKEKWFKLL